MAKRGRPRKTVVPTLIVKGGEYTITKEQLKQLKTIEENLGDLRRALAHMDEHETISKIAFAIGQTFSIVNQTEDMMTDVLEDITGETSINW